MLILLASLPLLASGTGDPVEELAAACTKVAEADNYSFEVATTSEGGGGFGGRGAGAAPAAAPLPVLGSWQKDKPLLLQQGEQRAFRKDGDIVYADAEGKWKAFDFADMRGAFGRRRGRGGEDRGGEAGPGGRGGEGRQGRPGSDAGAEEDPERARRNAVRSVAGMRGTPLPHELLAGIEKKVTDVEKAEKGGAVVYSGKLTPEAAAGLGAMGRMSGRGGRGGRGGGPEMEHDGTFLVVVKDGVVQSVEFSVKTSGSFGDRTFERTQHTAVALSKIGATAIEVPEAAVTALQEAAAAEEESEVF